jgi:hypothetical protein
LTRQDQDDKDGPGSAGHSERLPEFDDPMPGYHVLDLAGVFLKLR